MFEDKASFLSCIDKSGIIAIIPARGGSKGVPKKNIQDINGYPLLAYSIAAGKLSKLIQRIIVSTDSEEIANIGLTYGAEVPFLRPSECASDNSGDIEFMEHAIKYFFDKEGSIPEYIVHLRPTTPLRNVEIVDEGIKQCVEWKDCSSLRSAHKASESPYKWFLKTEQGYFKCVKDGVSNDEANMGRQLFPDVYIPDGYVDVVKSSFVIQNDMLHGEKMIAFESPDCLEIDTMSDLERLRYEMSRCQSALYDYLKTNF